MAFAAVYPALGSDIHSTAQLAALLGAKRTDEGCIVVDCHLGDQWLSRQFIRPSVPTFIRNLLHYSALSAPTRGIVVDCHQRASVPGLYAAGDVVLGLDQMSHAMGQAGVAATAIRNDLCDQAALLR
jgi:hypothetical protein